MPKVRQTKQPKQEAPKQGLKEELALVVAQKGRPLQAWYDRVDALVSRDEYNQAGEVYRLAGGLIDEIEKQRTKYTKPLNAVIKELNADAKKAKLPLEDLQRNVGQLLLAYETDEQAKAAKEVELIAKRAEKRGELQYANDLRQTALTTHVTNDAVQVVNTWKGRVTNLRELLQAVVAGIVPESLVEIKEGELNRLAKTYKEELGKHVPGAEGYEDKQLRRKAE